MPVRDDAGAFIEEKKFFSRLLVILAKRIMQNMDLHHESSKKFMSKLNWLVKEKEIDEEREIRKFLLFLASNFRPERKQCMESTLPQPLTREFDQSFQDLTEAAGEDINNLYNSMYAAHLHSCLLQLVELYFPHLSSDIEIYQNVLGGLQSSKNGDEILAKNDDEFCLLCHGKKELQLSNENENRPTFAEDDDEVQSISDAENFDPEIERYLNFMEERLYSKLKKMIFESGDLDKFRHIDKENNFWEKEEHTYGRNASSESTNEGGGDINVEVKQRERAEADSEAKAEQAPEKKHILGEECKPELLGLVKKVPPRQAEYAEACVKKIVINNQSDDATGGQEYSGFIEGVSSCPNDLIDIVAKDLIKDYREANVGEQLKSFKQEFCQLDKEKVGGTL